MFIRWIFLSMFFAGCALAQTYEVGAIGGYGFTNDLTVKAPAGSATSGLARGGVIGAFGGDDTYRYFSGEARYLYSYSDLRLSSGSTSVDFPAHTHIAEGAILMHFRPREARIRPFVAVGGGIKVLVGTGVESASQPLGQFAALTATHEIFPTADVGAGVKINLQHHLRLRLEVRDYISSTPNKVIAPAPGASSGGLLNQVMALASLSLAF
jgi:hypothetical protein